MPKTLRTAHRWKTGQELIVIDGILLKLKTHFPESSINDVTSCLKFKGNVSFKKGKKQDLPRPFT